MERLFLPPCGSVIPTAGTVTTSVTAARGRQGVKVQPDTNLSVWHGLARLGGASGVELIKDNALRDSCNMHIENHTLSLTFPP